MKKLTLFILTAFALVFWLTLSALTSGPTPDDDTQAVDSLAADRAKYTTAVRAMIKGKEKKPADSVFKNIQSMKGMPAGRLIAIMDIGYSQSLGVSCGHCHNTSQWDSDEKPQKQIAREMIVLVAKTRDMLKEIKGIKSENPVVNCTTCHRGQVKPALDLGK